jgi:hypothetical protein
MKFWMPVMVFTTLGLLAACSGGGGDSTPSPVYSYNTSGICVDNSTNTAVAASNCNSNVYNSLLFTWNGSQCINTYSGTPVVVNTAYCQEDPFQWQGANLCWDTIANQYQSSVYCIPANEPYYQISGVCYSSVDQSVMGSTTACAQEQTPIDLPCNNYIGTEFFSYYGGTFTPYYCGSYANNCSGMVLYTPNNSGYMTAYQCQ